MLLFAVASAGVSNEAWGRDVYAGEGSVVTIARATARIYRKLELSSDGILKSAISGDQRSVQVTKLDCDQEFLEILKNCVFMIYEMQ